MSDVLFECLLLVDYRGSWLNVEFDCQDACALASVFSCVVYANMDDVDISLAEEVEDDHREETVDGRNKG